MKNLAIAGSFVCLLLPLKGLNRATYLKGLVLCKAVVIMEASKGQERSIMKVRIELDPSMDEPEILIRAPRLTQELAQLQESILKQKLVPLAFYKVSQ